MVGLIVVSVALMVWGFAKGYTSENGTVDALLYWGYTMVGLGLFCWIVLGLAVSASNNPKSVIKLLIGLVAVAAICGVAYLLAQGAPAMGMLTQPSAGTLKLTDTILNLIYFVGGLAIVSIIFGEIWGAIRK